MKTNHELVPLLVVRGAHRALDFYVRALGAKILARFAANAPSLEPSAAHAEEITTLRESSPRVHLVVGPVGAGKSTFALLLAREQSAVRFTLDEWMTELFGPDRPLEGVVEWYVERAARSVERIWAVAERIVETGTSVVLELGLLRRSEREQFYERVDGAGFDATIHVIDAPRDVRRERVDARNRAKGATFSMVVPPDIFELASDLWEPPSPSECEGRDVRFVRASG